MCVVSYVSDYQTDRWNRQYPQWQQWSTSIEVPVSRAEFDALKKEVEALRELLKAAQKFDEETGQPDCELAEKVDKLRKMASLVGVDLDDVLGQMDKDA